MRDDGEDLLNLLFPPLCPFCLRVSSRAAVCRACRSALPWLKEEERRLAPALRCAGALRYEGAAREALLRFKFRREPDRAAGLGRLLAQVAAERFSGEFDTVTWVPVSEKRRRQRGFDQGELLARSACRCWDTVPERLLEKRRDNRAQSALRGRALRRKNVRDVYRALGGKGRRVLLIDDICTSGATFRECGRTLLLAGAASVVCAAVALAAEKRPGSAPGPGGA